MALKEPRHKIQSSLANFKFAIQDLSSLWPFINWEAFAHLSNPIVRSECDLRERLEALQLSVLSHHLEITRAAFNEFRENYQNDTANKEYLENLGWFLFEMRNAFAHAEGTLIAKGNPKQRIHTIGSFKINIPVKLVGNEIGFDAHSKVVHTISFPAIEHNQEIKVTPKFLQNILLLSYHVLEITKKKKIITLNRYLTRIQQIKTRV